jgi:hypothetical protein
LEKTVFDVRENGIYLLNNLISHAWFTDCGKHFKHVHDQVSQIKYYFDQRIHYHADRLNAICHGRKCQCRTVFEVCCVVFDGLLGIQVWNSTRSFNSGLVKLSDRASYELRIVY